MTERWDVVYFSDHVSIEPHFCRDYDCYGSNNEHGVSWQEAVEEVASWYDRQARAWRDGSHPTINFYKEQEV